MSDHGLSYLELGLEHKPTTDTETSLAWLPRQRRAARGQDPR